MPRIVGLSLLNAVGIHALDGLTVTRFALASDVQAMLTPEYSFALAQNFRPQRDWRASIRAFGQPAVVLSGQDDEAFHAKQLAPTFRAEDRNWPVGLLPGIDHVALTLEPRAIAAAVQAVERMNAALPPS